jgi:pimeloyl-ACP methyl ester carboxylesterase
MPHALTDDGIKLYYEETGSGTPVIFVHEFAGDHRSWEGQVRFFARRFRCITYNARGYPPSEVPEDGKRYSQARARDDVIAVLDHLKIERAHVVGLSMGGFATLHVGLRHPQRALSLVIAGCGYGAAPAEREKFRAECETVATLFETEGAAEAAKKYAIGPTRVQLQNKDPRAFAEFAAHLAEHSARGHALTMRGVQMQRPSLWDLLEDIRKIRLPVLIMTGDEDTACLEPALLMKSAISTSGIAVLPKSGHAINLEESEAFNRAVMEFFTRIEAGRWGERDPRSVVTGILGFRKS